MKVITAKNWDLTPAADGRRYSKFPDGEIGDSFNVWVSATIDGVEPGYRIKPPGGEWGAWQAGHTDGPTGFVGVTTNIVGARVSTALIIFAPTSAGALNTLTNSDAVVISSQGHEIQVRRKSSADENTTRYVDVHIGDHTAQWAVTTGQATVDPPTTGRDDILLEIAFKSFTQDQFNPPYLSSSDQARAVDGYTLRHIANGDFNISSQVEALPHVEIKAGDHVVDGTRAIWLTTYGPNHVPSVPYLTAYGSGTDARPRIDSYINNALIALYNRDSRYTTNKGYEQEFWVGFSIYLPSDFIFDTGVGSSLTFQTCGESNQKANWNLSHPTVSSSSLPRWRIRLTNWNGSPTTYYNALEWTLDSTAQAAQKGKQHHWVIHFKPDTTGASTGFFHAWHNMTGDAPAIKTSITNARFGYNAAIGGIDRMRWKAFANYKASMHYADYTGKYTGTSGPTSRCHIGFDAWRLGGNLSNFASVHPLGQEQP